jgi:hypothetical protein
LLYPPFRFPSFQGKSVLGLGGAASFLKKVQMVSFLKKVQMVSFLKKVQMVSFLKKVQVVSFLKKNANDVVS